MEKLIEYYNEYYQKKKLKEYYDYIKDMVLPEKFDSLTFLKDFCKWLVENNKIDIEKVIDTASSFGIDTYYFGDGSDSNDILLLMVLAVKDEPIEFLISILK